jgi:hypothetical protein
MGFLLFFSVLASVTLATQLNGFMGVLFFLVYVGAVLVIMMYVCSVGSNNVPSFSLRRVFFLLGFFCFFLYWGFIMGLPPTTLDKNLFFSKREKAFLILLGGFILCVLYVILFLDKLRFSSFRKVY